MTFISPAAVLPAGVFPCLRNRGLTSPAVPCVTTAELFPQYNKGCLDHETPGDRPHR